MILKDLDFLSPSITLFHYGRQNHSSEFGGVLTVIGVIFCFIYLAYQLNDLINYKTLSLFFYNKFEYKSGKYFLDNDGIFHFIQFRNHNNDGYFGKYDKKYIRVFISKLVNTYSSNMDLLQKTNHWVYDLCEEEIDNKNIDKNLFNDVENFTNSVCIKYYYDSKQKKYYNKSNKNFIFPFIELSNSRGDNTLLGIIIEKCNNNSLLNELLGPCGSENEIEKYLQDFTSMYLTFIDNQIDPTNFKKPVKKYFNTVNSMLTSITYPVHNVNFSPLIIKTDKGRFFNKKYFTENSFVFDTNRKDSKNNNEYSTILCQINFWMQNNFIIYDRSYRKLLDFFPYIGGVIEITYYVLYIINYMYNRFKIISNTKNLFFKIHTGRELNFEDSQVEETFVRKFKFMLNEGNNNTSDFKRRASSFERSVFASKVNNEIIDRESKKKIISKNLNTNLKLNHFNNFSNDKKSKDFFKLKSFNLTILNKNNIIKETSYSNYIDNSENKLKLQNSCNNNFSFLEGGDKNSQSNANILCRKNRKSKLMNLINEKKNNNNEVILSKDIERYNAFKEDLKRYMNENIKKVMCPNKKIEFIEDKFSFINYLFSLCCNKKKKNTANILERFRRKLISEEHLYRSHINLYSLEKYFETQKKKIDILELYKNL